MTTNAVATLPSFTQNMLPSLPAEMRNVFLEAFAPAMDTFGSNFNRLSLKGMQFSLIQGGQSVYTEGNALNFVIVGLSPDQFCVWYANKYSNGDEGVAPDAVWAMNEEPPANVPAAALQKDVDGRNQYSVRRRMVIAPFLPDHTGNVKLDLDNLYVWDMGGMTTFGADLQVQGAGFGHAHSFSGYMNLMKNSSMIPAACMTRAILDRSQSVPVARFFPHVTNDQITQLDNGSLQRVAEVINSAQMKELLDWRRGAAATSQPTPAPQQVQQPVQQVQQPVVQQPVVQQPVVQQPVVQQPVTQQPVQQATVAQPQTVAQPDLTQTMTQAVQQAQQPVVQQPVQQPVQQQAPQQTTQQAQAPVAGADDMEAALAGLMNDAAFA